MKSTKKIKRFLRILSVSIAILIAFPPNIIIAAKNMKPDIYSITIPFSKGTPEKDKKLLSAYIQTIKELIRIYPELRDVSTNFNNFLISSETKTIFSMLKKNPSLQEAVSALIYIRDKAPSIEERLIKVEMGLEREFISMLKQLRMTKRVPDGFIEIARRLDMTYRLHEAVFQTKNQLIFKASIYLTNTNTRIDSKWLTKFNGLAANFSKLLYTSFNIRKKYQKIALRYDQDTINWLRDQKNRTRSLIKEIERKIALLQASNKDNDRFHADLLRKITLILKKRIELFSQRINNSVMGESTNFIYVPSITSDNPHIQQLIKKYEELSIELSKNSLSRLNLTSKLRTHAFEAYKLSIKQDSLLKRVMLKQSLSLPASEKIRSLSLKNKEILKELYQKTKTLDTLRNSLLKQSPFKITTDKNLSKKLIKANVLMEDIYDLEISLSSAKLSLDLAIASLIKDKNSTWPELSDINKALTSQLLTLEEVFHSILVSYRKDQTSFKKLKLLSLEILKFASKEFQQKAENFSKVLDKIDKDDFYLKTLREFNKIIRQKAKITRGFVRTYEILEEKGLLTETDCLACIGGLKAWTNMQAVGNSITTSFAQLSALTEIGDFISNINVTEGTYDKISNLISISLKLDYIPIIKLHKESIDLFFIFKKRIVFVKNIGDPSQLNLALSQDIFIPSPPYIGFGINFVKAWQGTKEFIGNTIESANNVVSYAYETAGKIACSTQKTISTAVGYAGSALKGVGEVVYDFGSNVVSSMFLDENGNISWLKVGAYAVGGAACIATGGAACVGLAIVAGADVIKGGIDTAAMDKYNLISKKNAEWAKLGVDVVSFVAGGVVNLASAAGSVGEIPTFARNAGKLKTALIFLGLNPEDLAKLKNREVWKGGLTTIEELETLIKNKDINVQGIRNAFNHSSDLLDGLSVVMTGGQIIDNTISGKGPFGFYGDYVAIQNAINGGNSSSQSTSTTLPGSSGHGGTPPSGTAYPGTSPYGPSIPYGPGIYSPFGPYGGYPDGEGDYGVNVPLISRPDYETVQQVLVPEHPNITKPHFPEDWIPEQKWIELNEYAKENVSNLKDESGGKVENLQNEGKKVYELKEEGIRNWEILNNFLK